MKRYFAMLLLAVMLISSAPVFAHSGRTDSSGGHRDNRNASGLGSYHYHHGNGPHLHKSGKCPYKTTGKKSSKSVAAYTTRTGRKYHRSGCRYLSRSKYKTTQKSAKSRGYSACKVCW